MTDLGSAMTQAAAALAQAGFDAPRRRARRIVAASLSVSPAAVLGHPERSLSAQDEERLRAVLGRVLAHEPLSRILGRREFWGLDFGLSADTLDPRPETETVVEAILERLPDRSAPLSFLDLGTGSGCILLALLSECPAAQGVGIDIAADAAATARANAAALGLGGRARFLVGDWGAALARRFEAIVANPPYIATGAIADLPREVSGWDPHRALDGGEDGLDAYRAIAAGLRRLLAPGAVFACEVGWGQAAPVATILAARGFAIEACERDLAGIERCVVAT